MENNITTTYTFMTFIDNHGNRQLHPYNDVTKDALLKVVTTENKPYIFDAKDYNDANEKSIEYFNVSVSKPI